MQWIFFILCILVYISTCRPLSCTIAENCDCYESADDIQYMCPKDDRNNAELLIQIEPKRLIEIDCSRYDTDIIPENIYDGFVKLLTVRKCPLTTDFSFKDLMKRIGVTSLLHLQYDLANLKNLTLTKGYFDGLEMLISLSFDSNNVTMVEKNVFEGMPNLTKLILNNNRIKLLPGIFSNLPNLKRLELAANNLNEIPKGVFKDLDNLLQLHLWQNNLTELASDVFEGLSSLTSLELSSNKLVTLPEDIFQSLTSLQEINLQSNKLRILPGNLFRNNLQLQNIRINYNPGIELPSGLFSDLPSLKVLGLYENKLESIPEDIFYNSSNLQDINLFNNNLATIPVALFANLSNLEVLNLGHNKLEYLSEGTFDSLKKLTKLYLQNNLLNYIDMNVFKNLGQLKELNMKQNQLTELDLQIFSRNSELRTVDVSYNQLTLTDSFNMCRNLEILDLSHNTITEVSYDLILSKVNIRKLNLSYNNITSIEVTGLQKVTNHELVINLSNNNIKFIDFTNAEAMAETNGKNLDALHSKDFSSVVNVSNNPLICDCRAYDLARYIHDMLVPQVKTLINLLTEDLICTFPPNLVDVKVDYLLPKHLVCGIQQIFPDYTCPENCICEFRKWDTAAVINCDDKNMTTIPQIHLPEQLLYNQTEVHLQGNSLVHAPTQNDSGYENVTKLFLSRNQLTYIDWVPPSIEELMLDNNNISELPYDVLKTINTTKLKSITLNNNTWKCDCLASNLSTFLRHHLKEIGPSQVMCADGRKLVDLNDKDLCKTYTLLVLALSMIVTCFFLVIAVGLAFFYRYQEEVKVWLFAHNMFLWWVTEEVIDKDKKYDAFICFSHKDEDFVIRTLMPVLEQGPQPYKICIHFRDWIAGEFIATQIAESVANSRRTIIILSRSFLESVWGRIEFQTAHKQSMSEGRARVIVILYGDINPDTDLDEELKAYIRTNTYVKWGDPWFWNKIKYALPHAKRKIKSSAQQKLQNIMYSMDDKINFAAPQTPNNGSTPPVISVDSLVFKKSDIDLSANNNKNLIAAPSKDQGLRPLLITSEVK